MIPISVESTSCASVVTLKSGDSMMNVPIVMRNAVRIEGYMPDKVASQFKGSAINLSPIAGVICAAIGGNCADQEMVQKLSIAILRLVLTCLWSILSVRVILSYFDFLFLFLSLISFFSRHFAIVCSVNGITLSSE